jgi:hypothetical protein
LRYRGRRPKDARRGNEVRLGWQNAIRIAESTPITTGGDNHGEADTRSTRNLIR